MPTTIFWSRKKTTRRYETQSTALITSIILNLLNDLRSIHCWSSGDLLRIFTRYLVQKGPVIFPYWKSTTIPEKRSMGRIDISFQARQIVQRCHDHSGHIFWNGSCGRVDVIFRRYWQQGMLCCHLVHLLWPGSIRCRRGALVAACTQWFLHALQNPSAAIACGEGTFM